MSQLQHKESPRLEAKTTVVPANQNGPVGWTAVLGKYLPVDWLFSGYLLLTAIMMAVWGGGQPGRWRIVIIHSLLLACVFIIVRNLSGSSSGIARFIRLLYLPLSITYFYRETADFIHLFYDGWFDQQIIVFEKSLLGVTPTIWLQSWLNPILNEWMMFGYGSYYPLVAASALIYFFAKRDRELAELVWAQGVAFFISYLGFMIYPVQGPRYELAAMYNVSIDGFILVPLIATIMKTGAIHGGCMPSSHVAAGVVSFVYLWRYNRKLGYILLPIIITLCLGTVYGRFHYVSDVVVGLVVAVFALWLVGKYPVKDQRVAPRKRGR